LILTDRIVGASLYGYWRCLHELVPEGSG
jgi:hypothetical protein